jgi:hypothetical protein
MEKIKNELFFSRYMLILGICEIIICQYCVFKYIQVMNDNVNATIVLAIISLFIIGIIYFTVGYIGIYINKKFEKFKNELERMGL